MRCQACLAALRRRGRTRRRVAPRAEGHPRPRAAAATGPATERGIPGGAEPLRRNAGSCRRHDRVIGVKNVGETSGIAYNSRAVMVMQQANGPALRPEDRPAWHPGVSCPRRRLCVGTVRCRSARHLGSSVVHTITGAPRMAIDALSYIRSERMLCRETRVNDIFAPSDV
jgi:hypothetical protein